MYIFDFPTLVFSLLHLCYFMNFMVMVDVRVSAGCSVLCGDGSQELFDGCIMAVHAPDAVKILGNNATFDEMRVLGAFQYVYRQVFL